MENYQNIFNRDFYPTPTHVIEDMLKMSDVCGKIVLEPSAGIGNIVDYLQKRGAKAVLTCEINDKFRSILAGKSEVVGSDFLQLGPEQISHIDMIVMNPPFSTIKKHLLHAWEIAPDGCEIVSLTNSSMFESTYYKDKEREQVLEIVEQHGSHEELGAAFAKSDERQTDVNVSVIRIYKPKTEEFEFDDYFSMEADDQEYEGYGIMPYNFVRDIVNRYVEAVKQFDSVMAASDNINSLIKGIGVGSIRFGASGDNTENITRDMFKKRIQKEAWRWVFNKFEIDKYVTSGVLSNINKFVELQQNIPFTMRNIYKMVDLIILNSGNFMNAAICEAFDYICDFSAENSTAGEKWKTNSNYMVNRKFIIPNLCVYDSYGYKNTHVSISSWGKPVDKMNDVIKALCFITGKPFEWKETNAYGKEVERRLPSVSKFASDRKMEWGEWYEWTFFRIKGFKKGTMHFEFIDEDVWYKFNQAVAKQRGWSLPQKSNKTKNENRRKKATT